VRSILKAVDTPPTPQSRVATDKYLSCPWSNIINFIPHTTVSRISYVEMSDWDPKVMILQHHEKDWKSDGSRNDKYPFDEFVITDSMSDNTRSVTYTHLFTMQFLGETIETPNPHTYIHTYIHKS